MRSGGLPKFACLVMDRKAEVQGLAPKVFFVDPDPSLVSESFLESAFLAGYETYSIPDDLCGDLKQKIHVLVAAFPESLFFFSIDRKGSRKVWIESIRELTSCGDDCTRIGVFYSVKSNEADQGVRMTFNFDIGVSAGYVPLGSSVRHNHALILKVLEANQAMGRRKAIRMKCDSTYTVHYLRDKTWVQGSILDLSVSHFSAWFTNPEADWDLGQKVEKLQLRLGGRLLMVNALIALKHETSRAPVFVFLYHPHDENEGSEETIKLRVNQIIRNHFQSQIQAVLEKHFDSCGEPDEPLKAEVR